MGRKILYAALTIITLACLAPLGGVLWSSSFAARHGCTLHEGYANPCVVNGVDYGDRLYSAFVSGWLLLVTGPVALIAFSILLALVLLRWLNARRKNRS